jgi:hypothetical protein
MTHKLRIALAATLLALAAVSGTDIASAGSYGGGDFAYFGFGSRVTDLAFAVILLALAAVSVVDSASAVFYFGTSPGLGTPMEASASSPEGGALPR